MEAIQAWKTEDGVIHTSELAAKLHENWLKFKKTYNEKDNQIDVDFSLVDEKTVYRWLIHNRVAVSSLLAEYLALTQTQP